MQRLFGIWRGRWDIQWSLAPAVPRSPAPGTCGTPWRSLPHRWPQRESRASLRQTGEIPADGPPGVFRSGTQPADMPLFTGSASPKSPCSMALRSVPAVPSGRRVMERPPLSSKVYISFCTTSVVSPTDRLNSSVCSKVGDTNLPETVQPRDFHDFFSLGTAIYSSGRQHILVPLALLVKIAIFVPPIFAVRQRRLSKVLSAAPKQKPRSFRAGRDGAYPRCHPCLRPVSCPPLSAVNASYTGRTTSPSKLGVPSTCRTGVCFAMPPAAPFQPKKRFSVPSLTEISRRIHIFRLNRQAFVTGLI